MSDMVQVAIITGVITLVNGPLVITLISKNSKKNDEIKELREDVGKLFKLVDRIAAGLTIGLKNDKVIFEAFRKNSINGDSEIQDKVMDDYFTECTVEGFKSGREE
ncbi:hypothetical protein [Pleomorphochaeta sp. DL1XJH-081]|uniref:hypothetical protein n=1 Tax=Pleomorphochaeta sp. DL1XJH-081 TaxID=3409690 RepID=UPI003BB570EE